MRNIDNTFAGSFRLQQRVIGALLMREIVTRYGRDNLGFLWLFVEPMLFTLGVTALWITAGLSHGSTLPVVAFALTGYSSVLLWRNCATRASMAIPPNLGLLYHRNVRVLDLFAARILLEIAGATMSFVLLAAFWISLGWMELPNDIAMVIAGWLFLSWFGAALALLVGALTAYSEIAERLWQPMAYMLFPLSGAAFMLEWMPSGMRKLLLWIPMVHGVEMLREGYFGTVVRTHYDTGYLFTVCAVTTLLGLALVRGAGRRVQVQ